MRTLEYQETTECLITRGRRTRDFLRLFPQGIRNVFLVMDPADQSEAVLAMVLQLAESWHPQITIVHGGKLRDSGPAIGQPDRDDLVDLLCIGWEMRNRYADVSISRNVIGSRQQLVSEAAELKADIILIPEALAACFHRSESVESEDGGRWLPCPVAIVVDPETDWDES